MDNKFEGVIYMRKLVAPGSTDYGKVYIGQTVCIEDRNSNWYKPNNNYGGMKIAEARKRYGVSDDAWETKTVEKVFANTEEELHIKLDERETANIIKYDSVNNGFNGSYGSGMEGVKHSDEARKKISANHRHYQSEEAKQKISIAITGRNHTDEAKNKISKALKGKKRTYEQRKAQSERLKGKEPVKASEAAKEYRKTHKPYWQEHPITDEMRANMKAAQQKLGKKVIAIYPDGTTQEFNTMLDAANACDMNVGSVSYLAKSNGISAKNGMRFQKIT